MTGLGGVLAGSLRVYRARPGLVVPVFVVAFVALRLLPSLAPDAGGASRTAVLLLVQAAAPAAVGSLLFAFAVAVLAAPPAPAPTTPAPTTPAPVPGAALTGRGGALLAAAGVSAVFAVLLVLLFGPAGYLLQPWVIGPPVLLHAIVLERLSFRPALARARTLLRDARVPMYVFAAVVLTVVAQVLATGLAGLVAGGGGPSATAVRLVQGMVAGVTLPYVAAVGFLAYQVSAGARNVT